MEWLPLLILAILLIGMFGAAGWLLRKQRRNLKALRERGLTTTATVVGHMITKGSRSGTAKRRPRHWLKLQYIANETGYQQTMWVSKDTYDSMPVRSEFDILYLPENPTVIMRK